MHKKRMNYLRKLVHNVVKGGAEPYYELEPFTETFEISDEELRLEIQYVRRLHYSREIKPPFADVSVYVNSEGNFALYTYDGVMLATYNGKMYSFTDYTPAVQWFIYNVKRWEYAADMEMYE